VKRWWHTKDEAITCILVDLYSKIIGKKNVTFDEVASFCQRMQPGSGKKATPNEAGQPPSATAAAMIKSGKDFVPTSGWYAFMMLRNIV
jgi:hypothetical protein